MLFVQCAAVDWNGVVHAVVDVQLFHPDARVQPHGDRAAARSVVDSKTDAARFNQPDKERHKAAQP